MVSYRSPKRRVFSMNNQKAEEAEQLDQICFKTKPWMGECTSQSTHPCSHVRARVYTYTNTCALPSVSRGMWPHRQAAAGNAGSQKTAYLFSSELQTPSAFHYSAPPATVNKFVSSLAH